ncbi:Ulp1 family isopeptidase [Neoaquamicrobium sediminum]|uniref:Ulp1 family isopeptidase n=1 Tax=Neoaquamicrobium sediminum TaxID=1849104 RepID=UPI00403750E7
MHGDMPLQAVRFNKTERRFLILQCHVGLGIRNNEEQADQALDQYKKDGKILKKLGMSQLGDASVILIPFNITDNHWTVAAVYVDMQKVVYYDPIAVS